jgi:hypothetical protein
MEQGLMPLHVFTAQIRYVKANKPDAVDVSRVGNWLLLKAQKEAPGEIFAPSWDLLNAVKEGAVTADEYDVHFIAEMRASYRHRRRDWEAILARPRVVLCCYEPYSEHCHRHILRERILPLLGAIDCGEIES